MTHFDRRVLHGMPFIGLLGMAALASARQTQIVAPTLQQRLDRMCEQLETQRKTLHIPGMSLAVVQDDKIILARGFGERDIEQHLPATDDTLFAIGSSTKAFTATLIGMLIDDGKMNWDDPVRNHLPDFHLKDPKANEGITIRDLLCHRSGLARTDLLWASGKASRAEILHAIGNAELYTPFREKFNYNNVMFLAAGEAAARTAGTDWDALVAKRIFVPLAMTHSNTTLADAMKNPLLSKGYLWDEDESKYKLLPMRDLAGIAPAGAINSNVKDMAQWVRLQLNKGELDGKPLVSAERLNDTWTKQINLAGDVDYGLGWMLHTWNKHRLVEHGGNIDGFGAEVAFLPDDHAGFVLLTNVTATPLQSLSINTVFDNLLGEWKTVAEAIDLAGVQPYLGKYHFDTLKADVTVKIQNGRLAVDVPGQMVFELKPPDEQGHWAFDFPQPIAVSFEKAEDGKVNVMKLYQAGLTFELPREGYTPPREVDAQTVQKYGGIYHFELRNEDWKVFEHNGRLAVDVPKQMVFDLRGPNDEGVWAVRARESMSLKFKFDDAGEVTGMTFFQAGTTFQLPRTQTASASAAELPTIDEVMALQQKGYGSSNLDALKTLRLTGKAEFTNQGVQATVTMLCGGMDRHAQITDLGPFGFIKSVFNVDKGWTDSSFDEFKELHGDSLAQTRRQHPLILATDWRKHFDKVEMVRNDTVDARKVHVVDATAGKLVRFTLFVDAQTGLVLKEEVGLILPGLGQVKTTITYEDYREVAGVQIPYTMTTENEISGRTIVTIVKAEANIPLSDSEFILTKADTRGK